MPRPVGSVGASPQDALLNANAATTTIRASLATVHRARRRFEAERFRMTEYAGVTQIAKQHRDGSFDSGGCARVRRLDRAAPATIFSRVKPSSPYRLLPAERRLSLVTHALRQHRENREAYAQRLVARGGGFRAATLMTWAPERLAKEVVRLNAESAQDELELLQLLYVELEPHIQIAFLDAAGVAHTDGIIPEELEAPYADAPAVEHAAGHDFDRPEPRRARIVQRIWTFSPQLGAWRHLEPVTGFVSER